MICPKCKKTEHFITERHPDGNTTCANSGCGFKTKTSEFQKHNPAETYDFEIKTGLRTSEMVALFESGHAEGCYMECFEGKEFQPLEAYSINGKSYKMTWAVKLKPKTISLTKRQFFEAYERALQTSNAQPFSSVLMRELGF